MESGYGGSTSLFFWRLIGLGRSDVDAAHGAFFELVNALFGRLIGHMPVVYYFSKILLGALGNFCQVGVIALK